MFLVDWFTANLLMAFTVIVIFGIAVVSLVVAFTKKEGAADSKEKYEQSRSSSEAEEEKKTPATP